MEKLKIYATEENGVLFNIGTGIDDESYSKYLTGVITNMCSYAKEHGQSLEPVLQHVRASKIVRVGSLDLETAHLEDNYAVLIDLKDFKFEDKEKESEEKKENEV